MVGSTERAFVTLLTDDTYLAGAQTEILERSVSVRIDNALLAFVLDRVVLVTPDVSASTCRTLLKVCSHVIKVEPIGNPFRHRAHVPKWVDTGFTKLHIWGLVQYSKVVYLDADCLVCSDLTELLHLDEDFAAAPDIFPPDRFNAGVLVIRPDESVLRDLLDKATSGMLSSYDGGDTGFLNAYFADWFNKPAGSRLPFCYNAQRTLHWMTHAKAPGYWDCVGPKIIHYCASPKPWEEPGKRGDLEMLWWSTFVAMQLQGDLQQG